MSAAAITRRRTGAKAAAARPTRVHSYARRALTSVRFSSADSIDPPECFAKTADGSLAALAKRCAACARRLLFERRDEGFLVRLGQLAQGVERRLHEIVLGDVILGPRGHRFLDDFLRCLSAATPLLSKRTALPCCDGQRPRHRRPTRIVRRSSGENFLHALLGVVFGIAFILQHAPAHSLPR